MYRYVGGIGIDNEFDVGTDLEVSYNYRLLELFYHILSIIFGIYYNVL